MLGRLPAALFAALFFGALPVWWFSSLDGPVSFSCAGTPWRCEVRRWVFFETKTATYEPARISAESRRQRRRSTSDWRIVFTLPAGTSVFPTDWGLEDERTTAEQLEAARVKGEPLVLERPASPIFWLAVILCVLFIGSGLFIVLGRSDPASIGRGRPDA